MMNLRGNVSVRMRVTRSKRIKFDLYVLGDSLLFLFSFSF